MTLKVSLNQYGRPYPSDSWAFYILFLLFARYVPNVAKKNI